jgi:hypothetical protein
MYCNNVNIFIVSCCYLLQKGYKITCIQIQAETQGIGACVTSQRTLLLIMTVVRALNLTVTFSKNNYF